MGRDLRVDLEILDEIRVNFSIKIYKFLVWAIYMFIASN